MISSKVLTFHLLCQVPAPHSKVKCEAERTIPITSQLVFTCENWQLNFQRLCKHSHYLVLYKLTKLELKPKVLHTQLSPFPNYFSAVAIGVIHIYCIHLVEILYNGLLLPISSQLGFLTSHWWLKLTREKYYITELFVCFGELCFKHLSGLIMGLCTYIIIASLCLMQDTACLELVHGDDPERCYGEGGGRGVHVWECM